MTTSTQIIITILSTSGLLSFLGFLFKRKITLEIENSIKTKYDLKLETLKNELNISHSILTNSLITQNEGLKVTHAKRLEAIEKYWIMIIISEELINSIRFLDSILSIEEFEKIDKKNSTLGQTFQETLEYTFTNVDLKRMHNAFDVNKDLEKMRPYLGEELWLYKFYFDQYIGRIIHQYKTYYESEIKLIHWSNDLVLIKSLNNILSEEESKFIFSSQNDSINKTINILKQKILHEIAKTTSGALVGKSSIDNAIALSKIIPRLPDNDFQK